MNACDPLGEQDMGVLPEGEKLRREDEALGKHVEHNLGMT